MWEKSVRAVRDGESVYAAVNYSKPALSRHQKDLSEVFKCLALVDDSPFWDAILKLEGERNG